MYICFATRSEMSVKKQPWLSGKGGGLVSSKPGFSSHWYPYESLMVAGMASSQNYCRAPVKVLP